MINSSTELENLHVSPPDAKPMLPAGIRVLVACEFSGIVRDAFAAKGFDAWSCDILPTEKPGNHLQCDVKEILNDGWDLMIAHPPCTYLSRAGTRWLFPKGELNK